MSDEAPKTHDFRQWLSGPGSGRAGRFPRCQDCAMHLNLCLCQGLERLPTRTRVVLICHRRELQKSTNTGRLLTLILKKAEIRVRGVKDQIVDCRDLDSSKTRLALLYPSQDATVLNAEWMALDPRPVTLIVPDGNWRQARKVARRVPGLERCEAVKLKPGPPSKYRLRHHVDPSKLATYEAVTRALAVLEQGAVKEPMDALFDRMVERTLWTRGELSGDRVSGGIPSSREDLSREHRPRS